jgi:PAS domain S-box-containing protein
MSNSEARRSEIADDYRLLIKSITDYAIFRLDTRGLVMSWNAGAQLIKGYSSSEIIGRHYELFFTPEDRADGKPEKALIAARTSGKYEGEDWRVRRDGDRFWARVVIYQILDESGQLVGFAKVTRDLTEKRAADALRQSERRFRLLLASVHHHAIYTLNPEGLITSWDPGAERIKGYSGDEILGHSFSQFYTAEDQASGKPFSALQTARASGRYEDEGWRVRKDGSRFWASAVIEPMIDEDGQLIGFTKITRDISEKLALEEAKEQLHQAQKMEAISQLTGGVAHDFNNLLAIVMGSLELSAAANQNDKVRRLLATAQRAAQRGANLTSQLLAFARRQILSPQVSNINTLIANFETLLRQAGKGVMEFRLDFGADLWLSNIDQGQFLAALLNLTVNARDAMPTGGVVTIETSNVRIYPETAALLEGIAPGSYVKVVVRDTGEGMIPEVKAKAIEPFFTTKEVGRGTGLGLSQVYGFVRQSNGQMTIASEVGLGTSVTLYLPTSTQHVSDIISLRNKMVMPPWGRSWRWRTIPTSSRSQSRQFEASVITCTPRTMRMKRCEFCSRIYLSICCSPISSCHRVEMALNWLKMHSNFDHYFAFF